MKSFNLKRIVFLITVVISWVISGCANLGKTYSEIDPAGALEDIRKHNGYYSLRSVTPGTAKLVLRNEGTPSVIEFSMNTAGDDCGDFTRLGISHNPARGIIYPWIADAVKNLYLGNKPEDFIVTDVVPGQSILINGRAGYAGTTSFGGGLTHSTTTFGRCGPLLSKFTPRVDRAYLVKFVWSDRICTQSVWDATNPDEPVLVPPEEISSACKK